MPQSGADKYMVTIAENVFNRLIKPILDKLEKVERHGLSLYSNGSGGPPGYLENARQEDQEWKDKIEDQINPILRYVSARQTIQEYKDKRWRKWKPWVFGIGAPIIVSLVIGAAAMTPKFIKVVEFVWEDYLKAHPQVEEKLNSQSTTKPANTSAQDATNPYTR
jgi:hypothetical protein